MASTSNNMLIPNREKRVINPPKRYEFDECYCAINAFISLSKPKNINEALKDEDWVIAMQENSLSSKGTRYGD